MSSSQQSSARSVPKVFRTLPSARAVIDRVEAASRKLGLVDQGVLVAASGGADSTALLIAMAALSNRLSSRVEVASLDHGLRRASAKDVERVRGLARSLGLPFHTCKLRLGGGAGIEERARIARYAALEALRVERGQIGRASCRERV